MTNTRVEDEGCWRIRMVRDVKTDFTQQIFEIASLIVREYESLTRAILHSSLVRG